MYAKKKKKKKERKKERKEVKLSEGLSLKLSSEQETQKKQTGTAFCPVEVVAFLSTLTTERKRVIKLYRYLIFNAQPTSTVVSG